MLSSLLGIFISIACLWGKERGAVKTVLLAIIFIKTCYCFTLELHVHAQLCVCKQIVSWPGKPFSLYCLQLTAHPPTCHSQLVERRNAFSVLRTTFLWCFLWEAPLVLNFNPSSQLAWNVSPLGLVCIRLLSLCLGRVYRRRMQFLLVKNSGELQ